MKRRWTAALGAVLLAVCCVLSLPGPAAAVSRKSTYFTAVNDTVLELRDETMPFPSGGELYVPYTIFDPNSTGIQLGVFASYGNNVVVLYSRNAGALVFDLAQDTATSSTGAQYSKRAIRHNSIIFVPAATVAGYFGLNWSILVDQTYGSVVRVKNSAAQIQDADFLTQGKYTLQSRYNAYLRGKGLLGTPSPLPTLTLPQPTPLPTFTLPQPTPSQSPQPTPSTSPQPTPSQSPQPSTPSDQQPQPTPSQSPQPEGGDVYTAVRCSAGGDTSAVAGALERQGAQGVFFFPVDQLAVRDGEVRALAAAGHKIGLLLDGDTLQARQAQAEKGSELLAHILRTGTDIALAQEGAQLPEGWLAWSATTDGTAQGRGAAGQLEQTLEAAVQREDCFLLLDDSAQTASVAARLLDGLAQQGCTFRLSLEPMLAG